MNTEFIKKSINDKFNDLNNKIDILALELITTNNNEQIYGYTANQLLKKIYELNNEMTYAYIAGFFDGEGSIGIYKNKKNNFVLIVSTANTNFDILIKMKKIFGGYISLSKKKIKYSYKDQWHWVIHDRNVLKNFLEKILPYSTVKRQQIEYGLKYLELTTNFPGKCISSEEQKIREFFADKLREMKHSKYTDDEMKIFEDKINDINKDKNQLTMEDY